MIIADANVIIFLVLETTMTPLAREVYACDPDWGAPPLWKPEVLNGLLREVRAGHVSLEGAITVAQIADQLLTGKVFDCDLGLVLRKAQETGLTAYDANYVVLARSLHAPLVTEDRQVLQACPDVACSMRDYLTAARKTPIVQELRAPWGA